MPQSYTCLHFHFIFSTKNREKSITPDIRPRLHEYLGGIFRAQGGSLIAAGGIPDHVHLLASLNKQVAVSAALRDLKANSSGWMHQTFPGQGSFAWQTGYAAFAVSYSNLAAVKAYIQGQEEHHRKVSFKEELILFLKRHGIEYDERYLWT